MDESGSEEVESEISFEDFDISVAHWHVNAWGGAEYLATKLAEAVGESTVYTMGEPDPEEPNPYGDVTFEDVTEVLDYPRIRRLQRYAGRVFEYSQWEDVDWRELGDPDVLLTSGSTTRAVITPDDTLHVNYCHSPPRWFYDLYHDRKGTIMGQLARPLLRYLRVRDQAIDSRVDHYFVNSPIIKRRLWKYYKRDSEILYPPVDIDNYRNEGDGGYFLHLGRLDEEKGVPAVVEAFHGLDERLIFAGGMGDINQSVRDEIVEASNIEYRGFVSEDEKLDLLANCSAVVFNGRNEDFGIVSIEANASGKPVLVRNEGFPAVFVEEGENGCLHTGKAVDIRRSIQNFQGKEFTDIASKVDRFSLEQFETELRTSLEEKYADLLQISASTK
ncbi:MAG: glycosyltransferase [Halodesulfurarchaeum sp.]|nr:glycosyltransferase [Halodesulfurarchaeum sp.]